MNTTPRQMKKWKAILIAATMMFNSGMALAQVKIGGSVYGGGELGKVTENTSVNIYGGTIGTAGTVPLQSFFGGDSINNGITVTPLAKGGNVFGGGEGSTSDPSHGQVLGNTAVTMSGGQVLGSVLGGGEQASVGSGNLSDKTKGIAVVTVTGGIIGPLDGTGENAYVFGGGRGIAEDASNTYKAYANVDSTHVVINLSGNDARIWGSVFGGSANGHVLGGSWIEVKAGTIGTDGTTTWDGNVFGGGRNFRHTNLTAGRVAGNIKVDITGGTMLGSVFGGGRSSLTGVDVNGTAFTTDPKKHGNILVNISGGTIGDANTIGSNADLAIGDVYGGGKGLFVANSADALRYGESSSTEVNITNGTILGSVHGGGEMASVTGATKVILDGGTIGTEAEIGTGAGQREAGYTLYNEGHVYGGGKGKAGEINYATANSSYVEVNDGYVVGSVYGAGESGHVLTDSEVKMTGGTIGQRLALDERRVNKNAGGIRVNFGNVYGGGSGNEHHTPTDYSATAGRVHGNASVTIEGGTVRHGVFGGGEMASVGIYDDHFGFDPNTGTTTVLIKGNALIGPKLDDLTKDAQGNAYTAAQIDTAFKYLGNNEGIAYGACRGIANDAFAGMVFVDKTYLTVEGNAQVAGSLFGGSEDGHVETSTNLYVKGNAVIGGVPLHDNDYTVPSGAYQGVTLHLKTAEYETTEDQYGAGRKIFRGNVYGGGRGIDQFENSNHQMVYSNTSGRVYGTTNVSISETPAIYNSVYGGGAMASVGEFTYDGSGNIIGVSGTGGKATVNVSGGTIGTSGSNNGDVYGGGRGDAVPPGDQRTHLAYVANTEVNISGSAVVKSSVFGGGANGHVQENTKVLVTGGTIGTADFAGYHSNVFGGGGGMERYTENNTELFSQTSGHVHGNTEVEIQNGSVIYNNVYGGGAIASVDGLSKVNIRGGTIGTSTTGGNVYGAPRGIDTNWDDTNLNIAFSGNTQVNLYTGTNVKMVFGGGEGGQVNNNTQVNLYDGTVSDAIYGGGQGLWGEPNHAIDSMPGRVKGNTEVNLLGGTVASVFGGARRSNVWGDATVNVGLADMTIPGTSNSYPGTTFTRNVYGANSYNGTPYGDVTVNIYKTAHTTANEYPTGITSIADLQANALTQQYAIQQVFGGGYRSNYTPKQTNRAIINGKATVHVYNCDNTIKEVFGGGNAAHIGTSAKHADANVIIDGGRIHHVFGGGNGDPYAANVNGTANTNINGGLIDVVYGAGNKKASVLETNLVVLDNNQCQMLIDSIFGGANVSPTTGDINTHIACADGHYENIYGGSNNARIEGNVTLTIEGNTITNVFGGSKGSLPDANFPSGRPADIIGNVTLNLKGGTITRAFGGSDMNGDITGLITVNVIDDEDANCGLNLDYVYGGSQNTSINADASITASPVVNIKHGTVNFNVYGGSRGETATVKSNPVVNIGDNESGHVAQVNGCVFGGGESASVEGNATVNVNSGTVGVLTYDYKVHSNHTALDTIIHGNSVISPDFSGKVFGGGQGLRTNKNAANITGNTYVNINGGQVLYNVYGGGELANVSGTAFVNVYGGQVGPAPKVGTFNSQEYNIPIGLNSFDGYVFGGGQGIGDDPIDYVYHPFGAYYQHANVGTTKVTIDMPMPQNQADTINNRIWGSVFGGAEDGHVLGNANVYFVSGLMGTTGTTSYDGNIFGGGRNFHKKNYTAGRVGGNIKVEMGGGQIYGSIFGGGRLGIVGLGERGATLNSEGNYQAMQNGDHGNIKVIVKGGKVGNERLISKWTKSTMGDVYGGGKGDMVGVDTHPEASALLISLSKNTEVIVKDSINNGAVVSSPIIYGSVYGGGEVANVGNFTWKQGQDDQGNLMIYDIELRDAESGLTKVTVSGGTIGAETMQMRYDIVDGTYDLKYNDDVGHVFGGGEGYAHNPGSYATVNPPADGNPVGPHNNISLLDLMATVGHTEVTISESAFVKGSVYGGSENGHVLNDATVTIAGGQVGCGIGMSRPYTDTEFTTSTANGTSLAECPHWDYGDGNGNYYPFDPLYITSTPSRIPSDGKTWFGNVFGGGSGYYPYVGRNHDNTADSLIWNPRSGIVEGNSTVEITDGHILTSVYGGGEVNSVLKNSTVEMSGGTVGVPRSFNDILAHPVTCGLYGSGKGDPRTNFNTYTNVKNAIVEISGGRVYGSAFGGGEEGHVLENATITVSGDAIIGNYGYTGVDGNVFGAGRGFAGEALTAGTVGGNTEVNIDGGVMLGSVYGGGRDASVGTYLVPITDPNYGMMQSGDEHGYTTVNITDGTIGNDYEAITHTDYDSHPVGGNVFGGGKGSLDKLGSANNPLWAFLGKAKQSEVNITGGTIKCTVYGGGELGTVSDSATVIVNGGTIWRDVYGGGYGSDKFTAITATIPHSTITASPMQISGRVYGNTMVKIKSGWVKKSVYGGGELASVGNVTDSIQHIAGTTVDAHHVQSPFHISWPYAFTYADETGNANVKITGGRVGITGKDYMGPWDSYNNGVYGNPIYYDSNGDPQIYDLTSQEYDDARQDNGDVFGGSKGMANNRYLEAHASNVNNAAITINYANLTVDPTNYKVDPDASKGCVAGSVYGGGENGHVNENTNINLTKGLIGHAVYGGGKGKGKYKPSPTASKIYSVTAGKVYGNTNITMNPASNTDFYVVRSIFGGGNLGSVGVGNYAGGVNDYSYEGYGEQVTNATYWADTTGRGHTNITINKGTIGMLPTDPTKPESVFKDNIPYGSVFGGCRGLATPDVDPSQIANLFENRPDVFYSYVNHTFVKIGADNSTDGPRLYGSVYGGAQDGHVRWNTHTVINSGEIGADYGTDNVGSTDLTSNYWTYRGNVFGGGSGLGTYEENNVEYPSSVAGSVTQSVSLTVNGGIIHRNVYGGGNLATVGPPRIKQDHDCRIDSACVVVNINAGALIGQNTNTSDDYGGYVFGSSRGLPSNTGEYNNFALCPHTIVTIDGAHILKDVYGGGENGQVAVAGSKERSHTTTVNINGSTAYIEGSVYGGGQGIWGETGYENDSISGRLMGVATVNLNDGTVHHNAFGGGRLGVTHGPTYVNVSGSTVDENVFGGAYGQRHLVHVLGLRMVNMRSGLVKGNVYGGSFNALDALALYPGQFSACTSTETVSVVNYSGGHTMKHVFGAGDHGNTFGSTYVFVGKNAIMNAPYHTATTGATDPYNEAFYTDHGDLIIDRDVWAGADFGEYTQGVVFGESTIAGRSNIYVDGTGYDTESSVSQGDDLYMILRNSIFGCGTLNDGGKQGKEIMVRDYGHVVETTNPNDPEPYADATRLLHSIQYADSLIIESSHFRLKGRGIVNINEATEEYAFYNIFNDVRMVNGSSVFIDKPINNIGNLHSNLSDNLANHVYPTTPSYTEVDYADLSPNCGSTTPNGTDNKIRINKGGYLTVSITTTTSSGTATSYGALRGFFHLMADGVYNAFAYARPKQSTEPGNIITQLSHNYPTDGGFVCYRADLNIYDVDGGRTSAGGIQLPYENHTPDQRESTELYFRVWRFKENAQSVLDVVLHAFADPNNENGFSYYVGTVTLPPQNGTGSYYRIKTSGGTNPVAEINYGSEIKLVNAGFQEPAAASDWMFFDKDNGAVYNYSPTGTETELVAGKSFMQAHPNNAFGLTAIPAGGLVGSSNDPWLICSNANDILAADNTKWLNNGTSAAPQVMFMLTNSNKVNGNHSWDPVSITLQQWVGDQLVDEVMVHVQVVTSTSIEQDCEVNTYAMMTHSPSSSAGNHTDIYRAKVLLPTYTLSTGANEYSTWSLKKVEWKPNTTAGVNQLHSPATAFDQGTLVAGQPYTGGHTPTSDFVGMTFFTSENIDDVNGWLTQEVTSANPIDLGYLKEGGGHAITTPINLGTTKAVDPISFEFNLLYDSKQNIGLLGNADMGTIELTVHFDNYANGTGSDDGKDVKFKVHVHRRGKGKGFYIDGVHGDFMYSGKFPDAAQPSLAGVLWFAEDYEPVDSIFIVNKVTADAVTLLNWSTPYDELRLFRYNGGHLLWQDVTGTTDGYYADYKTTYPDNPSYKGTLVDVKTTMSVSSTIVDGAYELPDCHGYPSSPTPDIPHPIGQALSAHVISDGPMFNIMSGASLTINGINGHALHLKNNYNKSTNGGAMNLASGATLAMNRVAYIHDNWVADNGSEVHYGGGAYLEGTATILASDDVQILNNKHVGTTTVAENVYLKDYQTVISVGTADGNDTYAALYDTPRIGITKTAWDNNQYMPIVFTENPAHGENLLSDGGTYNASNIVFDQDHTYGLVEYPLRQANNDLNYQRKLYWVKTWVNAVTSDPTGGSYDPLDIDTPEKLAWAISVATGYNNQTAAPTTTFKITKDIDMKDYIWVPIGNADHPYQGQFEGNGHLVTGIHSPFSMENKGMFGTVTSGADIKNLQAVVDFYQGTAEHLGGLIGNMTGGTLSNCESAGYLESASHTSGGNPVTSFIGGLVGKTYSGSTIHSSFAVDTLKALDANIYMGGLVGEHTGVDLYNSYGRILVDNDNLSTKVGGLVGYNNGHVENCYSDVGTQSIPTLAYENYNGTIQYCYANGTNYVGTTTGTGSVSGHGTYDPVKGRKEIGYMYDDNKVTLAGVGTNNYVPTTTTYEDNHTIVWNGMLCVLNQWVKEKNAVTDQTSPYYGKNFTKWFRPTSEHVNADLPVLGFPKDNAMATLDADGRFLQYGATAYDANNANVGDNGLDGLLDAYKDKSSSIFLYNNAVNVEKWPVGDEKVFVNEDAVLLQASTVTQDFGNTTVGITFDNSSRKAEAYGGVPLDYDWHLMSTPLSNAKMGTQYGRADGNDTQLISSGTYQPHDSQTYPSVNYQDDPVDIVSMVDSYLPNGLTMGDHLATTDVRWDFYSYYEPEYHWINLKRNKNNHFHRDSEEGVNLSLPYQLDKDYGSRYKHYQIQYNATDQSATTAGDDDCVFTPGKGYMMAISQDSYMSSTGILNRNVTIPVTTEAPDDISGYASHNRGSNLVGNPYQAYLDLNAVSTTSVNADLNKFWVYDADHGNGIYVPYTKDASLNTWTPSQYIHPHQAFFVVKTTNGNTDMTFNTSMATTKKDNTSYFRDRPAYPLVNLLVTDEAGSSDLAIVEFNRPEVGGVPKIENLKNASFDLYARFDNESYGLLFTPEGTERVPVFFKTPTSGTYTLSWEKYNGTFSRMRLIDNITGTDYDMLTHDHYTFQAYNTDFAARFYIVFSVTGVDENDDNDSPLAYFNGEGWVVEGEGKLELVDMLGHVLYANNLSGERTIVHFDDFAAGMYMLRLVNSNTVLKAQKIVLE